MSKLHDLINEDGIYCNCKTDVVDTTATSYVEVTPDVGVILKNGDEVLRARKGDLIESLMYVDEELNLKSITGSLHSVMFITKRLNGRDYIKAEGLVIDKSSEFNSDLVRIRIQDIRGFKGNSVDPNDIKIYDVALDGDKLSFVTLFKPSMVTWNGDLISVKLVGETPTGNKYTATVPNVLKSNTITVIGLGSAVTTRTVEGLVPGIEPIYSDVMVQDTIQALSDIFPPENADVDEDALIDNVYVPVVTGVYGGKSCKIQINGREAVSYEEEDRVQIAIGEANVSLCPFRVTGGKMEVLAPLLAYVLTAYPEETVKVLANDFAVKLPNTKGDWLQPFVVTGAKLYGSNDYDDEVVYDGNSVQVTRSSRDVGVSLNIVDYAGVAVPESTMVVECGPESEDAYLPTAYTLFKTGVPNKDATLTLFEGKGEGNVTTIQSVDNQLNLVIPEYGMGEVNVTFKDILPKPKPEIARGFSGVSAVSNIQWIEAAMASAIGNFEVSDNKLYLPLLTNIDEQFDSLVVHMTCNPDASAVSEDEGDDAEMHAKSAVYKETDVITVTSTSGNATVTGAPFKVDMKEKLVSVNVFLLAYLSVLDATENVVLEAESTMVALPDLSEFAGVLNACQPKVVGTGASIEMDGNTITADLINYDSLLSFNLAGEDSMALGNGTVGLVVEPIDHETHKVASMSFAKVTDHVLAKINPSVLDEDGNVLAGEVMTESTASDEWMFVVPGLGMANVRVNYRFHLPVKASGEFTTASVEAAYAGLVDQPALTDTCYVPVLNNVRSFDGGMDLVISSGVPVKSINLHYDPANTLTIEDNGVSYNNHPVVKWVKGVVSVHVLTLIPILDRLTKSGATIQFLLNGETIQAKPLTIPAGNSVVKPAEVGSFVMKNKTFYAESVEKTDAGIVLDRYQKKASLELTMNPSLIEEGKILILRYADAIPTEGDVTNVVTGLEASLIVAPGGEFVVTETFGLGDAINEETTYNRYTTYASRIGSIYVAITCNDHITADVPLILEVSPDYTEDRVEAGINQVQSWLDAAIGGSNLEDVTIPEDYYVPAVQGLLADPSSIQIGVNEAEAFTYGETENVTLRMGEVTMEQPAYIMKDGLDIRHGILAINPVILYQTMALAGEANQTHIGLGLENNWGIASIDTLIPHQVGVSAPVSLVTGFGGSHNEEPNIASAQLVDGTIEVVRYDTGYEVNAMLSDNTEKKMTIAVSQGEKVTSAVVSYLNDDGSYTVLDGEATAADITEAIEDQLTYKRLLTKEVGFTDIDLSVTDRIPQQASLISGFNLNTAAAKVTALADLTSAADANTDELFIPMMANVPASTAAVSITPTNKGVEVAGTTLAATAQTTITFTLENGETVQAPVWKLSDDLVLSVNAVALHRAAMVPEATGITVSAGDVVAGVKLAGTDYRTNTILPKKIEAIGGVYDLQNMAVLADGVITIDRWDQTYGVNVTLGTADADFTSDALRYIKAEGTGLKVYNLVASSEEAGAEDVDSSMEEGSAGVEEEATEEESAAVAGEESGFDTVSGVVDGSTIELRKGAGRNITQESTTNETFGLFILGETSGFVAISVVWNDHMTSTATVYGVCADPNFHYEEIITKMKQLSAKTDVATVQIPDSEFYVTVANNVPSNIQEIEFTCSDFDGTLVGNTDLWDNVVRADNTVMMRQNVADVTVDDARIAAIAYPAFKVVEGNLLVAALVLHELLIHAPSSTSMTTLNMHGACVVLTTEIGLPYTGTTMRITGPACVGGGTPSGLVASEFFANLFENTITRSSANTVGNIQVTNAPANATNGVVTALGTHSAFLVAAVTSTMPDKLTYQNKPLIQESGEIYDPDGAWSEDGSTCVKAHTSYNEVNLTSFDGDTPSVIGIAVTWNNVVAA